MPIRKAIALTAVVAVPAALAVTTVPAEATLYYSSCTNLHRDFKHGVAKSYTAALKQKRQGYGMPAYGSHARDVYWYNHGRLDRDGDGTACEA